MNFLDCTLDTPEQNLALDEALLEACDQGGPEVLRVWRPAQRFVVVGYTQKVEREVNVSACRQDGIPILRRITGGGTVLHDAGSLCYALTLRNDRPEYPTVGCANKRIAAKHRDALNGLLMSQESGKVEVHGDTDLTYNGRKFSGNAQRRKIKAFLFHGTFLLNIDSDAMERYLRFPSRQPEYRADRNHRDFLGPLPMEEPVLIAALRDAWKAAELYRRDELPLARVEEMVGKTYSQENWNFKL